MTARKSPTREEPVVVEAECLPNRVRPGEEFILVVRVETAPTWHITAARDSKGPEVATGVELTLPREVMPEGNWIYPEPTPGAGGRLMDEGTFEFRRRLRVARDAEAGPIDATCTLSYQACDRFSCRMPAVSISEAKVEVIAP